MIQVGSITNRFVLLQSGSVFTSAPSWPACNISTELYLQWMTIIGWSYNTIFQTAKLLQQNFYRPSVHFHLPNKILPSTPFFKFLLAHLETIISSFSSSTARPGARLPDVDVDEEEVVVVWQGREVCEEWSLEDVVLQNSTPMNKNVFLKSDVGQSNFNGHKLSQKNINLVKLILKLIIVSLSIKY